MDDADEPVTAKSELLTDLRDLHKSAKAKNPRMTYDEISKLVKTKGAEVGRASLGDYLADGGTTLPSRGVLVALYKVFSEAILPDSPVSTLEQVERRFERAQEENKEAQIQGGSRTKHERSPDGSPGRLAKITNEEKAGRDYWNRVTADIAAYKPGLLRRRCEFGEVFTDLDTAAPLAREWLRDAVRDAFEDLQRQHQVPGGYVFVEGDAGVGKTTFAAWLTAWDEDAIPHFVLSTSPETRNGETALRSLAAQIVARYRLGKFLTSKGMLSAAADGPDGLIRVLNAALDPKHNRGHRIVLVIDGLDQALPEPGDPEHPDGAYLPLGLPAEALPAGVYVVATLRKGTDLQVRPARSRVISLDVADERNLQDQVTHLRAALVKEGAVPAELGADIDQLVARVATVCWGSWIYQRYLLADLRAGRITTIGELWNLPATVQGYYAKVLGDLRRYTDGSDVEASNGNPEQAPSRYSARVVPALCALAAAQVPVSADVVTALAGLAGQEADVVERFLSGPHLGAFVRRDRDQGFGTARYSPYHGSFRDFLSRTDPDPESRGDIEQLAVAKQARHAHHRIVDRYLTAWGGLDAGLPVLLANAAAADLDDGYGARFLVRHLAFTSRHAELHKLLRAEGAIADSGRPVNIWAHIHAGDVNRYRRHLSSARSLAARPVDGAEPDLALDCRYLLMLASVRSARRSTSPAMMAELVRRGLGSPIDALAQAAGAEDREERVRMVEALAPHLRGYAVKVALDLLGSPKVTELATYFILVDHLEGPAREEEISRVWNLLCNEADDKLDDRLRAVLLVPLAPLLSEQEMIDGAADVALTLARSTHEIVVNGTERRTVVGYGTDPALCALARRVSEQKVQSLLDRAEELMERSHDPLLARALVPRLSGVQVLTLAETARRTQSETYFDDPAWASVIGQTDWPRQRALDALRSDGSHYGVQFAWRLVHAAPHLSPEERARITGSWRKAGRKSARACVFAALAPWMPPADQHELIDLALSDLERDTDSWIVTLEPALTWLAPVVRGDQAVRAAKLARRLDHNSDLRSTVEPDTPVVPTMLRGMPQLERDRLLGDYFEEARRLGTQGKGRAAEIITAFAPLIADKVVSHVQSELALDTATGFTGGNRVAAVEALLPYLTDGQLRRVTDQQVSLGEGRAVRAAQAAARATLGRLDEAIDMLGDDIAALLALAATTDPGSDRHRQVLDRIVTVAPDTVGAMLPLLPEQKILFFYESEYVTEVLAAIPDRRPYTRRLCKGPYRSGYGLDYSAMLRLMLPYMTERERNKAFGAIIRDPSAIQRANGFAVLSLYPPKAMPDRAQEVADQPGTQDAGVHVTLAAGLVRLLPEHERPAAATAVLGRLGETSSPTVMRIVLDCIAPYLTPEQRLALVTNSTGHLAPVAVLVPLLNCATASERTAILRAMASHYGSYAHSEGILSTQQLNAVGDGAVWFWQDLFDRIHRFTRPHHKVALLSTVLAHAYHIRWYADDRADAITPETPAMVGPIGPALSNLPRPELLVALTSAFRHIHVLGGKAAVEETDQAIDDARRWWA
ncbi:NACHT domain-containing protein [Actinosynnema sp. CS-041913]|uniref:NACHT domain-containing protein n=1 Tax=Actinosynnema sp. CS-041913 TaxID=3239917 RepID=UPI003D93A648